MSIERAAQICFLVSAASGTHERLMSFEVHPLKTSAWGSHRSVQLSVVTTSLAMEFRMKKLAIAAGALALLLTSNVASAMTDADCATAWKAADTKSQGVITETQGRRYFAAMRVAQKPVPADGMSQAAFMENCKAGLFDASAKDAGAPLSGANSFTESQAKDRIMATGLSDVSALKKDDKGVWRGTATDGSKKTNVAVDYKGNVVAE